jgi:hypothetical protein
MPSELSYQTPRRIKLGPIPDSPPNGEPSDYWESRKSVQIPVKQYFEWINVNIWTCQVNLSHSYARDNEGSSFTLTNYTKSFEVNVGRENKGPGYIYSGSITNSPIIDGQVYQTTDPSFPLYPQTQGAQPESWWMKQRSNVLINNHERSYFNATSFITHVKDPDSDNYYNYNYKTSFGFGIMFGTNGDSYYDPDTKMIWPYIQFESFSTGALGYGANWYGTTGQVAQVGAATITVDGVSIPAQVEYIGNSAPTLTIQWTPGSTRYL